MACLGSAHDSCFLGSVGLAPSVNAESQLMFVAVLLLQEALGASERVISYLDAPAAPQIAPGQPLPAFSGQVPLANSGSHG